MSLDIRPEQYPIVGENLLAALVEVLGSAVDSETLEAWRVAYAQLTAVLTGAEAALYAKAAWTGYRPFRVTRKQRESDEITSFYLMPADGGAVPSFVPGQYVTVKRFVGELVS